MLLDDLEAAIGPAVALFLEGLVGVRQQAVAVAVVEHGHEHAGRLALQLLHELVPGHCPPRQQVQHRQRSAPPHQLTFDLHALSLPKLT